MPQPEEPRLELLELLELLEEPVQPRELEDSVCYDSANFPFSPPPPSQKKTSPSISEYTLTLVVLAALFGGAN